MRWNEWMESYFFTSCVLLSNDGDDDNCWLTACSPLSLPGGGSRIQNGKTDVLDCAYLQANGGLRRAGDFGFE